MTDLAETKEEKRQLKSLDQLQDWSKWMVGYEALTLGFTKASISEGPFFHVIVLFATLTILLAAWVLSSIPSVTRQVVSNRKYHEYPLYDYQWIKTIELTLDKVAISQHICFAITVVLTGLAVIDA